MFVKELIKEYESDPIMMIYVDMIAKEMDEGKMVVQSILNDGYSYDGTRAIMELAGMIASRCEDDIDELDQMIHDYHHGAHDDDTYSTGWAWERSCD